MTEDLTLKEALCAMLDGEQIECHRLDDGCWNLCFYQHPHFCYSHPSYPDQKNSLTPIGDFLFRRKPKITDNGGLSRLRDLCDDFLEHLSDGTYIQAEICLMDCFKEVLRLAKEQK